MLWACSLSLFHLFASVAGAKKVPRLMVEVECWRLQDNANRLLGMRPHLIMTWTLRRIPLLPHSPPLHNNEWQDGNKEFLLWLDQRSIKRGREGDRENEREQFSRLRFQFVVCYSGQSAADCGLNSSGYSAHLLPFPCIHLQARLDRVKSKLELGPDDNNDDDELIQRYVQGN